MAHQNASRGSAKRRIHDDAKRATASIPDASDHTFALIQSRVCELAKIEITRLRKMHGLSEAAMIRKIVYEYLEITTKE